MPNLRLPKVGLVEMMREATVATVDSWVNYSSEFREGISRNTEHEALKYAALMGSACNISLADLVASAVRSFIRLRLSVALVGSQQLFQ